MSIRLQIGSVVRYKDSSEWRTVNYIKYDKKSGEQLVCVGIKPMGFSYSKDMIVQEPVQLKFDMRPETQEGMDSLHTLLDDFYRQNPIASGMMLDGFMDRDVNSMCDGMRMFMNE